MADASGPEAPSTVQAPPVRDGITNVVRLGIKPRIVSDLYHLLLGTTWTRLLVVIIALYGLANTLFAMAYLACGDGIANAREGSFWDAFFFSIQTMSTIGYGVMVPRSVAANILVSLEALSGLLGFAMATGMMFAKFARPSTRVLFSNIAVVSPRDRVPSLMLRMANERSNQIVEAQLRLTLLRNETTSEGERVRRFFDLALVRSSTAVFALTWTAIHAITESSPLYGLTAEQLVEQRASITVSFIGFDETFSQTVHARHTYNIEDVRWNERFVDILGELPDGRRAVDYTKFHEAIPFTATPKKSREA